MYKLVIFDFDGVIITGSNEGYFICYHKALESVEIHLEPDVERKRILEKWGKGYKLQLDHLLIERPDLTPKAIEAYEKCYYSPLFTKDIKILKGAPSSLKRLAQKYTLAIASGMMRKTLEKYLHKYKISKYFKYVLSSEDIKNADDKKPSPYMLNVVLKHFNESPNNSIYVGDGKGDVEMARNAGIEPAVVLTGHLSESEAQKLRVNYILEDFTKLDEIIEV